MDQEREDFADHEADGRRLPPLWVIAVVAVILLVVVVGGELLFRALAFAPRNPRP
jgi:hypothetical protein